MASCQHWRDTAEATASREHGYKLWSPSWRGERLELLRPLFSTLLFQTLTEQSHHCHPRTWHGPEPGSRARGDSHVSRSRRLVLVADVPKGITSPPRQGQRSRPVCVTALLPTCLVASSVLQGTERARASGFMGCQPQRGHPQEGTEGRLCTATPVQDRGHRGHHKGSPGHPAVPCPPPASHPGPAPS